MAYYGGKSARDGVGIAQVGVGEHHDDGAVALDSAEIHLPHQPADDPGTIKLRAGILRIEDEAGDRQTSATRDSLPDRR